MPQITSRIVAGPLERMLLGDPDIYPNDATAVLSAVQLQVFRKQRSAGRWQEYPLLAIDIPEHSGRLHLQMLRPALAEMMGSAGKVEMTLIRLEFDRFTMAESQCRLEDGHVERELVLGTDVIVPDEIARTYLGKTLDAVMTLPEPLAGVFSGLVIESARVRGAGTAYGFGPSSHGMQQ